MDMGGGTSVLQCNPMDACSKIISMEFSGTYSQIRMYRIVTLLVLFCLHIPFTSARHCTKNMTCTISQQGISFFTYTLRERGECKKYTS